MQELLRHANSRITLDVYTQAKSPDKRRAQTGIVKLFLQEGGERKSLNGPQRTPVLLS